MAKEFLDTDKLLSFRSIMQRARRQGRLHAEHYPSVQVGYLTRGTGQHPIHMSLSNLGEGPEAFASAWAHLRSKPEFVPVDPRAFESAEVLAWWVRMEVARETVRRHRVFRVGTHRVDGSEMVISSSDLRKTERGHSKFDELWAHLRANTTPVEPGILDSLEGFEDWVLRQIDAPLTETPPEG